MSLFFKKSNRYKIMPLNDTCRNPPLPHPNTSTVFTYNVLITLVSSMQFI